MVIFIHRLSSDYFVLANTCFKDNEILDGGLDIGRVGISLIL